MEEKRSMKIVLQDGIKDCGICSLLSVIRYYGGEISKEALREMTNTSKDGVSAYNLIEAARIIGFNAIGVVGDMTKIENNNLPCLSHIIVNKSYKHFVVIYDINHTTKKVTIMDPAKGKRILSFGEFKLMSSSNYIFLKPIKKLPVISNKNVIKKTLKELFVMEKYPLILITILSFLLFIFQIITSFNFKYLLKLAIDYNLTSPIVIISMFLLIIYIIKNLTKLFRNILVSKCSSKLDEVTTFKTYKHLLLLPYLYYKNRTTGEVISRLRDLNIIKKFLTEVSCFLITDFISIIVNFLLLIKINYKLTLIILIFIVVLIIVQVISNNFNRNNMKHVNYHADRVNSYLVESLSNIDTLKNGHLEKRFFDTFSLKYSKFLETNYTMSTIYEVFSFIRGLIYDFLLLLILAYGSNLVVLGRLSLGNLVVYQTIFSYFFTSFSSLLELSNDFYLFKIASKRIEDMFLISKENFACSYSYSLYKLDGAISFKNLNVSFYGKDLFNDLSFEINPKDKILLVGKSGSGKSTLVKILMRYCDIPYGYVSINGIDINHYHLDVLRKRIVYVSNLEMLFTDTIYNNIVLGRNISKEEFLKIVDITLVSEFVSKDLSFQQLLEENGSNLSNGERQRIILARALVKEGDIYIFDEAFSQIDSRQTIKIMQNMFNYLSDKTVIVISHRVREQKLFNRLLKLENGKINEVKKL